MSYMRDSTGQRLDEIEVVDGPLSGRSLRNIAGRAWVGDQRSNGTDTSQTARVRFVLRGPTGAVRLVFSNFYVPTGGGETVNAYSVTVKASIEDPSVNGGNAAGAVTIPIFFNGSRTGVMAAGGILISDPVLINAPADWAIFVRSNATVASGDRFVLNYVTSTSASANQDGSGVSEGVVANTDSVDSGSISTSSSFAFGPAAIVAEPTNDVQARSAYIIGDSIAQATGAITVGFSTYLNQALILSGVPFMRAAVGGQKMSSDIQQKFIHRRMQLAQFARHMIINDGINDIIQSRTLAQLKADSISAWTMFARLGKKVHQATILPHPGASTDGYMTIGGQSIANPGQEAIRTGFNSWLRSGQAVIDSAGALTSVIDGAALIEVDATNTLTLNGGFWKVPAGLPEVTGTATAVSTTVITDTGKTRTANQDRTKVLAITSASTGAAQCQLIASNSTATAWTLSTAITLPTGTVQYAIGASNCYDHLHPTEAAHNLIAAGLDLAFLKTT